MHTFIMYIMSKHYTRLIYIYIMSRQYRRLSYISWVSNTDVYIYMYICICIYVCLCMCMCMCIYIYIYIWLSGPTTCWRVLDTDVELSILAVTCQHIYFGYRPLNCRSMCGTWSLRTWSMTSSGNWSKKRPPTDAAPDAATSAWVRKWW